MSLEPLRPLVSSRTLSRLEAAKNLVDQDLLNGRRGAALASVPPGFAGSHARADVISLPRATTNGGRLQPRRNGVNAVCSHGDRSQPAPNPENAANTWHQRFPAAKPRDGATTAAYIPHRGYMPPRAAPTPNNIAKAVSFTPMFSWR